MAPAEHGMPSARSTGSSSGSSTPRGHGRLAAAGARCASPRDTARTRSAAATPRAGAASTSQGTPVRPSGGRRPPLPPAQRSPTATTTGVSRQRARALTPQPALQSACTSSANSTRLHHSDEEKLTKCESLGSTMASESETVDGVRAQSADSARTHHSRISVWEHDFRRHGCDVQKLLQCQAPAGQHSVSGRSSPRDGTPMTDFEIKCRKRSQPTDPWKHLDPNPEGSRQLGADDILNQVCPPRAAYVADETDEENLSPVSRGRKQTFFVSTSQAAPSDLQPRASRHDKGSLCSPRNLSAEKPRQSPHASRVHGGAVMDHVIDRIYNRQLVGLIPVC